MLERDYVAHSLITNNANCQHNIFQHDAHMFTPISEHLETEYKVQRLFKKLMISILLIDYLPTGQTIAGQYYTSLLDQVEEKIHNTKAQFVKEKSHLCRTTPALTQVLLPWQKSMN